MKSVYKYQLELDDLVAIYMPVGAEILSANMQNGGLCVWALVDKGIRLSKTVRFRIAGTGHPIDEKLNLRFVDTVFTNGLVFHVFEVLE